MIEPATAADTRLSAVPLQQATADPYMECRRLDSLDPAFNLDAGNRYAYGGSPTLTDVLLKRTSRN